MSGFLELFVTIDHVLFRFINRILSAPILDVFFPAITDLHHTWQFKYLFSPLLFLFFVYLRRSAGAVIFLSWVLTMLAADAFGSVLKHHFLRQRPFEVLDAIQRSPAGGFSFPSNHAINMFCMFFFLSYFFPKARWLFFLIATMVAYSRIYNGVHFPSDVLAGVLIGSFFGGAGCRVAQYLIHKLPEKKKVTDG